MADTAFYTHGLFLKHKMGNNNPECPKRLEKIEELMLAAGTSQFVDQKTPPMVAVTDMLAAHDADYISYLSQLTERRSEHYQCRHCDESIHMGGGAICRRRRLRGRGRCSFRSI